MEIDEIKLGKRKYNRGHRVKGVRILAEWKKHSKNFFSVDLHALTCEPIEKIIKLHVMPKSKIYTNCFKSYEKACIILDLSHFTVNHSKYYKDPETECHTNNVEGLNNGEKTMIKPSNRIENDINAHLWFHIRYKQNKNKLFEAFFRYFKRSLYN